MSDVPMEPTSELLEEYALGLLSDAERAAVDARLAVDAAFRAELAAIGDTLGSLGLSVPVRPSPALKQRVMARVEGAQTPTRDNGLTLPMARRSTTPLWLGAALAASLALVAKLSFELRDVRHERNSASAAVDSTLALVASRNATIAQLTDPGTELVNLAATGSAKPIIRAWVNRGRRTMVLAASALTPLAPGRAYQLWFIVDSKPVPSVTFTADSTGHALINDLHLPAGAVAATAITDEPEGGSAAPTTKPMFVGKLATE